jgi:hypothetical protein
VPGPPLSERIERSSLGRLIISVGIVLVVLCEVGTGIPSSAIKAKEGATAVRVSRFMGVEQNWGVFSPDPRSSSINMYAIVRFEDGSSERWDLPDGGPVVENFRYYRWRKWLERIRADDFSHLWEPSARWIASLHDDRPSPVTEVELIRLYRENVVRGEQPPFKEFSYYTLELGGADG